MEIDQGNKTVPGTEEPPHIPFVEKYRPEGLSDIISHQEIVSTSKFHFWISNSPFPAFSQALHRGQKVAASFVPWAPGYRQDLLHDRHCEAALRQGLQKLHSRAERFRRERHRCRERKDQKLLLHPAAHVQRSQARYS